MLRLRKDSQLIGPLLLAWYFALTSGPATQWGLRVFRALPATPPATAGRWWRFRKYAA